MSTETSTETPRLGTAPVVGGGTAGTASALEGRPGVPFGRTLQAEVRKMVDTRAGRWMVIVMAAPVGLILAAFVLWGPAEDAIFDSLLRPRHAAPRDAAAGDRHHGGDRGVDRSARAWSPSARAAAGPRRPRQGAGRAASHWSSSSRRSPSRPQPSPTRRRHRRVGPRRSAAGGPGAGRCSIYVLQGVASGCCSSTPVAIVTVLVLPTVWSIATLASARSRTSAVAQPGLGHRRCSPARWRARTGPQLGTGRRRVGAAAPGGRHLAGPHT